MISRNAPNATSPPGRRAWDRAHGAPRRSGIGLLAPAMIAQLLLLAADAPGRIVFTEAFECETVAELAERWDEIKHPHTMSISTDVPPAGTGHRSLMIIAADVEGVGSHLYKRLPAGHDSLFVHFNVKFSPNHRPVRHFVTLGGYQPLTPWPQGAAGIRPAGGDRFTVGIEPQGARWEWGFYAYWMEMRGDSATGFFGNRCNPAPPAAVRRGEWTSVQVMLKMNEPVTARNGELALWLDGAPAAGFGPEAAAPPGQHDQVASEPPADTCAGFRWRGEESLKLNFLWLLYFVTEPAAGRTDTVWFDDVVVATEFIDAPF